MPATPTFYLYGEPHRTVEGSFVHVESLDDRSRPNEWTIRAHSHSELAHIFYIASGGGVMLVDGKSWTCRAPCLLLVPACTVHGFEWEQETSGSVITLATRRLAALTWVAPQAAGLVDRTDIVPLRVEESDRIGQCIGDLIRELGWAKVGHDAAVQAALLTIIVVALRQRDDQPPSGRPFGRRHALVARLRQRIEERFRERETVAACATALGTSETALRMACATVAGISPAAMIDQRALLEAQRALIFSDMSVGEIAYSVGFEDQAYFSRFFSKHVGQSPRAYRVRNRPASGEEARAR